MPNRQFLQFFYIFLGIETGIETISKIGNLWITLWITLDNFCLYVQVVKGCGGRVKGIWRKNPYTSVL